MEERDYSLTSVCGEILESCLIQTEYLGLPLPPYKFPNNITAEENHRTNNVGQSLQSQLEFSFNCNYKPRRHSLIIVHDQGLLSSQQPAGSMLPLGSTDSSREGSEMVTPTGRKFFGRSNHSME